MGKNDLSSLKIKQEKKLPDAIDNSLLNRKVGRPKKPVTQCENKVVSLKITADELVILKQKAGLIPLGRYIKSQLRENTNIFK
jgi:hypothetical protein